MKIISDKELQQLTIHVADALLAKKWRLATAESCTGGWLAKCCTDITGSSQWFDRGWVSYTNQSKQDMLNVNAATLEQYGAVSEAVACEMAQGALLSSSATISIAVTGIAGPSSVSKTIAIGTVCFSLATQSCAETITHYFEGSRDAVRRQAVATALMLIMKNVNK